MTVVDLWLPILVSAAAVWFASALAWMMMPHHKGDFKAVSDEDALINAVRSQKLSPGIYAFPDCRDHSRMKDPEVCKTFMEGPAGTLHIWPPGFKMGGKMIASFIFYVVVSAVIALLAVVALHPGEDHHAVFHVTALAGIMSYCFAGIPHAIWFNVPARNLLTGLIDGIVFGVLTGAIFTWLWPSAM